MGDLKIWDSFVNHMTIILRRLISNIKIYKALKYIILNILGKISPHSHKNQSILLWGRCKLQWLIFLQPYGLFAKCTIFKCHK
jgi:hypothetical protein